MRSFETRGETVDAKRNSGNRGRHVTYRISSSRSGVNVWSNGLSPATHTMLQLLHDFAGLWWQMEAAFPPFGSGVRCDASGNTLGSSIER